MTPPFILPLVLLVTPPQISPTGMNTALVASRAAVVPADGQPTSSTGAVAAPGAGDMPPELADPLVDPANQPSLGTERKAARHYPGDPLEGFNRTMFGIELGLEKPGPAACNGLSAYSAEASAGGPALLSSAIFPSRWYS